jgi:YHS domain-containing protein
VAFCCEDCKAKFQQDPAPYLAKLDTKTQPTTTTQ